MGTAVVTGAASGIGRALARALAAQGHVLYLADVASTADLAEEIGGVARQVDVSDPEELLALARDTGAVDVVCLNAGVVGPSLGTPWEVPPEEWQRLLGVNLLGVVNGLRAFVPGLLDRGQPARLLITASLAGLVTFPGGGAYAATKHAVVAVAEQASLLLRDRGVTVTLLCPALVRSGMSEVGEDPAEVAATALDAVARGQFLVMPEEWKGSLSHRSQWLAAGAAPDLPTPESMGENG